MAKYLIKFRLGRSIFERAIDPKFYIEDLKEFGNLDIDIIEENIPSPEDEITDEHKFYADIILETDRDRSEIEELLEFIIEDGVTIELLEEGSEDSKKPEEIEEKKESIPSTLLENYLQESEDIIIHLGEVAEKLHENRSESELINEMFRGFHTLKGNTGILLSYGKDSVLEAIKDIAHSTEGVLQKVRDSGATLNDSQIDILQSLIDRLDDLLLSFKEKSDEIPEDIYELLDSLQTDSGNANEKGSTVDSLPADEQAFIKVAEQYIPIFREISSKDEISDEENDFLKRALITLYKVTNNLGLNELFQEIKDIQVTFGNKDYDNLKIKLKSLSEKIENYIKEKISKAEPTKSKTGKEKKQDLSKYISKSNYLRIEEGIVQNIMDIVGEISVFKEWLNFFTLKLQREYGNIDASKELKEKYQRFKNLVENLQNTILEMRMIPLSTLFERFPKLVRDLSRQLNKKIKFIVEGGDTRLDKVIVEKIGEPMIHLIRNALDHGIETPEERKSIGKSEEGLLKIRAYQNAGNVFIEIIDDGKGIDPEIVKQKAIEKGIKSADEIEKMDNEEIINLIFLPGFSTKDKATEVSGRGVGTDAVLAAVSEFGGSVSVNSQIGVGSTFKLVLPLTLAIQKILLTKVGELTVGIPADMISEIVKIPKAEISNFKDLNVIHHREKVIEISYASKILNIASNNNEQELTLLIDNFQEKALVVDKVISTIDTVIKPAPDIIQDIKEISGVTILGDGSIVYIIDILS